jgi:hypothetical protein
MRVAGRETACDGATRASRPANAFWGAWDTSARAHRSAVTDPPRAIAFSRRAPARAVPLGPGCLSGSEAEAARPGVVVEAAAGGPVDRPYVLGDRQVVDPDLPLAHEAALFDPSPRPARLTAVVAPGEPQALLPMVTDGSLKPVVGGRYPLSAVREAHQDLLARRSTGKLILDPSR